MTTFIRCLIFVPACIILGVATAMEWAKENTWLGYII